MRGIRIAVEEEDRSGAHRIGQGAILYHRNLERRCFLTLADMMRTAGLENVRVRNLSGGIAAIHSGWRL